MVSGFVIGGIVALAAIYILFDDFFTGKHKAFVRDHNSVYVVKAGKTKDKKQYMFKIGGKKYLGTPKGNEFLIGKNKYMTTWMVDKDMALPMIIKDKEFKVMETDEQLVALNALDAAERKVDSSWWDRNKEVIVGMTAIAAGMIIYIVSVKYSADISPENLNACLQIAADIKNSTMTTENNINTLVGIISDSRIPN